MTDLEITESAFDRLSWHDKVICSIAFETADPEANDWTSDLVLEIDHIVDLPPIWWTPMLSSEGLEGVFSDEDQEEAADIHAGFQAPGGGALRDLGA